MNKIKKRTGKFVDYNPDKIKNAILGANSDIDNKASESETEVIYEIARSRVEIILKDRDVSVEEINDIVERTMIQCGCYELVKQFIEYRYRHKLMRESNTTDETIFELINGKSEYWNDENSNKNAKLLTTQRDYLAGITSTDIARRFIFPKKSVEAHDNGIIHIHDMDFAAEKQRINCCLVNLNDMLQNGTVLNGVKIEKPHRFITACTITTQIIVAVSASDYGGTTVTLTHLAPFVRYSFYRHYKFYMDNIAHEELNPNISEELPMDDISYRANENAWNYAKVQVKKEIEDGVQTFNYQVNSMSSTNGQAPFLSVCMYLNETQEYKQELAMIIEEFLKQRIQGMKNEQGVYITVAFPKLLYVLEEDNITENSKYWYLTELAAKCSAKRLVPDYVSEKVMKEYKVNQINETGDAYPCMGAAAGNETVSIKIETEEYFNIPIKTAFELIREKTKVQNHNNCTQPELSEYKEKCGIYKITHKPTGYFYIGSSKNISRRLTEHKYSMKHKGTLGDNYFIDDYDDNNLEFEILKECNINDLYKTESEYVNFKNKSPLCVNAKDPINNGNFTTATGEMASRHEKYSTYENKWQGTWTKEIYENQNIFILSNNEWVPIRKIMKNNSNCPLKLHKISYKKGNEIRDVKITEDHPLELAEKGRTMAANIKQGDKLIDCVTSELYEVCENEILDLQCETYDFTVDNDMFDLSGIVSHNCRSFLTPDRVKKNVSKANDWKEGTPKYYGRFNMGVASVNIPAVAVLSNGDLSSFWELLDKYCELCHDALKVRVKRLEECTSDIAPILYQHGAFARLGKGESLKPLIYGGYATISLGYAGLYETVKYFTGKSNTEEEGIKLQKEIMQFLNDKCNEWKKAENIDYSLYGTPIENTVGKFAKAVHKLDKDFFIKIDGKDRDFITNSYHVFVEEEIDAFKKLELEGEYQKLSPGGCISYVESADLTQNTEVVLELLKYMYDHTMYAEINTKSDYCQVCGYDKEIEIIDHNHRLMYRCPNCGNTDDKKMNVARRVCGYISTNIPNQARLSEIANRYVHVDNHE